MPFFKKIKWFQKIAMGILITFMGLMCIVTGVAYSRKSGHTGLDMGKIQWMRSNPPEEASPTSPQPNALVEE